MLIAFRLLDSGKGWNLGTLVNSQRPGYYVILLSPTVMFSMGDNGELNNVPVSSGDTTREQFKRNGSNLGAFLLGTTVQVIELIEL